MYKKKYIKYKSKYLILKNQLGGYSLSEDGIYVYFCNNKYADKICNKINDKTTTSNNINKILYEDKEFIAFRGKHAKLN